MTLNRPYSVIEIIKNIENILNHNFQSVLVEGEVSTFMKSANGHVYITLKEKDSIIKCAIFKYLLSSALKFDLKVGMKVIVKGQVGIYAPHGEYSIKCVNVEPSGVGTLMVAFNQLKEKLKAKGYFDIERKKTMPKYPRKIALITSGTGSVIQDMLIVSKKRWPLTKLVLIDSPVQGSGSAQILANNLNLADSFYGSEEAFDVIVLARGGGSAEDLWSFNEEVLADSIFRCQTPVVSAIGHETDYSISDFVADLRAATPSAAMEILLPDRDEAFITIDNLREQMSNIIFNKLNTLIFSIYGYRNGLEQIVGHKINIAESNLMNYKKQIKQLDFAVRLEHNNKILYDMKKNLNFVMSSKLKDFNIQYMRENLEFIITDKLRNFEMQLDRVRNKIFSIDVKKDCKKGYVQITQKNTIISLDMLQVGDVFSLSDANKTIKAKMIE